MPVYDRRHCGYIFVKKSNAGLSALPNKTLESATSMSAHNIQRYMCGLTWLCTELDETRRVFCFSQSTKKNMSLTTVTPYILNRELNRTVCSCHPQEKRALPEFLQLLKTKEYHSRSEINHSLVFSDLVDVDVKYPSLEEFLLSTINHMLLNTTNTR